MIGRTGDLTDAMLVLNAGSSSLKFAVFDRKPELTLLVRGAISSLHDNPVLTVRQGDGEPVKTRLGFDPLETEAAMESIVAEMARLGLLRRVTTVGHRIVHGGRDFVDATVLDDDALAALRDLVPLAPLHQPVNLDIVAAAARLFPDAIQVGCFDTAFHTARPRLATLYGLPRALAESGIVSYGFHGLSFGYIAARLHDRHGAKAGGRAIVAHLGSGSSLCGMAEGRSTATTMGFSPLDGLMMSTRCGTLDPGVILHLAQERKLSPDEIADLLYRQSGLLGVSGISGDMRALEASDDPAAADAIDLFVYRAGREIGSIAAALGGLDTLVFTAGIGENSPVIRQRISAAAGWLGVAIDAERNRRGETLISTDGSAVEVLVIPTDEERAVAEQIIAAGSAESALRRTADQ